MTIIGQDQPKKVASLDFKFSCYEESQINNQTNPIQDRKKWKAVAKKAKAFNK